MIERLNRAMLGWANYNQPGHVNPAYRALDRHAIERLRQWLCQKHKVKSGKYVRFPDTRLWTEFGLVRLGSRAASVPWERARSRPGAGNPHDRCNERGEESWQYVGLRHREPRRQSANCYPAR